MKHFSTIYLKISFCFLLSLCVQQNVFSQSASCPTINIVGAPLIDLGCTNICTDIVATLPDIRQTVNGANAYLVSSIPFAGNYGFNSPGTTPVLVNIDDKFSGVINLGYPFCFYGSTFTQVVVGANGKISFDLSNANQFDVWSIGGGIPSSSYERNAIFALFHDIDPSISSSNKAIEWIIEGQSPCRKLIVTWRNVRLYNNSNCPGSGNTSTFQAVLYENTNVIEMYIKKRSLCTNWNSGKGIIGVQNYARNQGVAAPSRNNSTWSTNDPPGEAWRFVPNGPSLLQGPVELLDENMNVIATTTNPPSAAGVLTVTFPNVCIPPGFNTRKLYVRANYIPCSGPNLTAIDSVILQGTSINSPVVVSPVSFCLNESAVPLQATTTGPGILNWYTTPSGGSASLTPLTPSTSVPGNFTYYVSQKVDSCESPRIPINVIINNYSFKTIDTSLCNGTAFNYKNNNYFAPNVILDTVQTPGICDSIITINVLLKPEVIPVFNPFGPYCLNEQVTLPTTSNNNIQGTWSNFSTSFPGTAIHTFSPNSGQECAIPANSIITVFPAIDTTFLNTSICHGDSYAYNGQVYSSSTVEYHQFSSAQNCDSIVQIIVIVSQPAIQLFDTLSSCKSIEFNNHTYTNSTIVNDTVRSVISNCDSIYNTTFLIINNVSAIMDTVYATICQGESYNFRGNSLNQTGVFKFVEGNQLDCDTTFFINLNVVPLPAVEIQIISEDGDLCMGKEVKLLGSGASDYQWYRDGDLMGENSSLTYQLNTQTSKIILKGKIEDCENSAMIDLLAENCCTFFLPNAFSPNGDGLNDFFGSIPESYPREFNLQIFNRYGQKVFQGFKPSTFWDGTFRGKECEPGVYYYVVTGKCENGEAFFQKGDLSLIR